MKVSIDKLKDFDKLLRRIVIHTVIGNSYKRKAMLKLFKNILTFLQQMTFNYFQEAGICGYIWILITYVVFLQLFIRTLMRFTQIGLVRPGMRVYPLAMIHSRDLQAAGYTRD